MFIKGLIIGFIVGANVSLVLYACILSGNQSNN